MAAWAHTAGIPASTLISDTCLVLSVWPADSCHSVSPQLLATELQAVTAFAV